MTERGAKKSEPARRLDCDLPQVNRLFDLRHASRPDQIESAARALCMTLEVQVASAARARNKKPASAGFSWGTPA